MVNFLSSDMQVICSVLQVLNQIIKDNTDFQENACLVGLVSTMYILRFDIMKMSSSITVLHILWTVFHNELYLEISAPFGFPFYRYRFLQNILIFHKNSIVCTVDTMVILLSF